MQKFFLAILFFGCVLTGYAQDYRVITYQPEQGLPHPLTKAIGQDELGFTWIATDAGLVRFDGKHFDLFKDAVPTIYVKNFYKRRSGEFLVIHDLGITQIVHTKDTLYFKPYLLGTRMTSDSTVMYPKGVYEDMEGGLWISEYNSVARYFGGKLKRYFFDERVRAESYKRSFQFMEDKYGVFWLFSQQGWILRYDEEKDAFEEINLDRVLGTISWVIKTKFNQIWIATTVGVFELQTNEKGELLRLQELTNLENVSAIVEDKFGNYFLGTWFEGLYHGVHEKGRLRIEPVKGLNHKVISNLYVSKTGKIWSASDDGVAFIKFPFFNKVDIGTSRDFMLSLAIGENKKYYTSNGGTVFEVYKEDGKYKTNVLFKTENRETILWIIEKEGVVYFCSSMQNFYWIENGKVNQMFIDSKGANFSVTPDSKGNIWLCHYEVAGITKITKDKQVVYYGKDKGFLSQPLVVKENAKGELWLGAKGEQNCLYKYDEQGDFFVNQPLDFPFPVHDLMVEDLAFERDGRMWLATNKGLMELHAGELTRHTNGVLKQIDVIKAIQIRKAGELWLGTDKGVIKYENGNTYLFDEFNGMPSKPVAYRSLVIDDENRVWVGTSAGLAFSNDVTLPFSVTPTPLFMSLEMNGKPVGYHEHEFHQNSFLEAFFVSPNFPSEKVTYQYRLKGFHADWITIVNKNDAVIPKIPIGEYTFEVRALQQGPYQWSEPVSYQLNIKPYWYLTVWAFLGYAVILGVLILLIVKFNTDRLVKEKQNLEKTVSERTAQVVQQKEEIQEQRDSLFVLKGEIEAQRDLLIDLNKDILEKKNKLEEKSRDLEVAFEEIQNQKAELEKLNATKNKFFSIVAHDLRGPLNSLSNFADLMLDFTDALSPQEIKRIGADLRKAVKNTFNLTDNLLAWARSQMDNLSHKPENVDVYQTVADTFTLLAPTAESKQLQLLSEVLPGTDVYCDRDQLTFVVRNLISNAIKFTMPEGHILVKAFTDGQRVEISVVDNGVGMSEEVALKIFDIGSKHSTLGTTGEKGTGLGLLLCKEFIEKNGGQIWVKSQVSKGSCFTVSLPVGKGVVVEG
jgi:signal transduction histidine kinase/ligand-binding sensor domain-containing protein